MIKDKIKQPPRVVIVMGVSGSGKSAVGRKLAAEMNWPFHDADDFHPGQNISKMSAGQPLTDADRDPWLWALHQLIATNLNNGQSLVLACSALKKTYRHRLRIGIQEVFFVYLRGDYDLIAGRIQERENHFMGTTLLRSQFAALEEPSDALVVDVDRPVGEIVSIILHWLDPEK